MKMIVAGDHVQAVMTMDMSDLGMGVMEMFIDGDRAFATIDGMEFDMDMLDVMDQIGSDDMLLFASDYPHRRVSDPAEELLTHLPGGLARKVAGEERA